MYFLKRWGKAEKSGEAAGADHASGGISSKYKDIILASILFGFNFFFLFPLFGQEYPSITFSAPILPVAARIISFVMPLNFSQAVGVLVLISFPLSSVFWYAFFKSLSKNTFLSFFAGLIFLLPWFFLPRLHLFWQRGDGIHALGFAFLPLAGIAIVKFLRAGSFNLFLMAFLGVSLVALASPLSLLNLYLFFFVLTFSEMLLGEARVKILRLFSVCLFAQGISSFWYHPEYLLSLSKSDQGRLALASFWKLIPVSFFTIPIFGAFSFLIFDRKIKLQPLFFALTFTLIYLGLVASENFGGYLSLSLPARFFPEFYAGLSLLLAILVNTLINLPKRGLVLGNIHPRLAFPHHTSDMLRVACLSGFLLWPIFSLFEGPPVFSDGLSSQVLGAQAVWWDITPGSGSHIVGYGVTLLTAACGLFLKRKIKN